MISDPEKHVAHFTAQKDLFFTHFLVHACVHQYVRVPTRLPNHTNLPGKSTLANSFKATFYSRSVQPQ